MDWEQISSTKLENALQQQLQSRLIVEIEKRGMATRELADAIGVFPETVEALLKRDRWDLDVGLRIAEALDIDVRFQIATSR